jgi:hypothetical protein
MAEEENATTNDVLNMLMQEGDVTTLPIEQDEEGNIVSIDKTNLEKKISEMQLSELAEQDGDGEHPPSALPPISVLELDDASILKVAEKFATDVKSSDIKTTKMFKSSFVGKAAVDWLVQNTCKILQKDKEASCSRTVAVEIGKRLLEKKTIFIAEGQKGKVEFADDSTVYQHFHTCLLSPDDGLTPEVVNSIKEKMKKAQGGLPMREEKVMLKKIKNVFTEAEVETWLMTHVKGLNPQDPPKVIKNLYHKKVFEKIALSNFVQFC